MKRSIHDAIKKDLNKKIVLVSGPRQVGKTTLAQTFYPVSSEYFNMDSEEHRLILRNLSWNRDADLVIFDELHKMRKWKSWLKGIYDTEGVRPQLLVTGSASLDTYRKGGDSLAGRFFSYRLHPFSVAEVKGQLDADEALGRIEKFGGFPEPFLEADQAQVTRWRRSHLDRILREDLVDLTSIRDVKNVETLVALLKRSVGSPISYDSLARNLQVSPHTIKYWISVLEGLFIIFVVLPYSKKVARSILKQPKIYFYDVGSIEGDQSAKFENAIACALLKRNHYLEDALGATCALHYVRDREKREVDFLTLRDHRPEWLIEAKLSDIDVGQLARFAEVLAPEVKPVLLVRNLRRERHIKNVKVKKGSEWLQELEA